MDSSTLLRKAWLILDSADRGYIYAKDVSGLLSYVSQELGSKLTTSSNDKVIESWSNNDPMKMISKTEFEEVFSMLVGTSFDTAVQMASQTERITPTKPKLFGSYRRPSQEEHQVDVEALKRNLNEWKEKYTFLEREFEFFLTHQKNPPVVDNTKHEFIISELNRKLSEQTEAIEDLKSQLEYGIPKTKADISRNSILRRTYKHVLPKAVIVTGLFLVYFMIMRLFSVSRPNKSFDSPIGVRQESWWERNRFFSRLQWYVKDTLETGFDKNNSEVIENYNSIFGLT